MDHVEKGEASYCVCPKCLFQCKDCLGGENERFRFLDRETIRKMKADLGK